MYKLKIILDPLDLSGAINTKYERKVIPVNPNKVDLAIDWLCERLPGISREVFSQSVVVSSGYGRLISKQGLYYAIPLRGGLGELVGDTIEAFAGYNYAYEAPMTRALPERHLHPDFHATLVDLYLYYIDKLGFSVWVFTHSEAFLMRLCRRITEGIIGADDIVVDSWTWNDTTKTSEKTSLQGLSDIDSLREVYPNHYGSTYRDLCAIRRIEKRD